jgi:hypothetical protein
MRVNVISLATIHGLNVMTRLFFDVVRGEARQLDFRGTPFSAICRAREAAELLSMDFACDPDSPWIGAEVQVRDAGGNCLFACSVREFG